MAVVGCARSPSELELAVFGMLFELELVVVGCLRSFFYLSFVVFGPLVSCRWLSSVLF